VLEKFHQLEKDCIGYDNYVNCGEENFKKTLEKLRLLVCDIQRLGMFSPNEEIKEIATENVKLLMAPYYEADVLFRIMENRMERVKLAHVFYLEYLKLLNHYGVLEKDQIRQWKTFTKK
jgi:molecular chaperone DnaK (HSP70)